MIVNLIAKSFQTRNMIPDQTNLFQSYQKKLIYS